MKPSSHVGLASGAERLRGADCALFFFFLFLSLVAFLFVLLPTLFARWALEDEDEDDDGEEDAKSSSSRCDAPIITAEVFDCNVGSGTTVVCDHAFAD